MFSGFPVAGSFSRTAVNYQAGARTPRPRGIAAAPARSAHPRPPEHTEELHTLVASVLAIPLLASAALLAVKGIETRDRSLEDVVAESVARTG